VREIPNVKRALNLVQDVRDIQESVEEAQKLITRLEQAINSPAKIKIFPEFAAAKASSLEVENRLVRARNKILAAEAELVRPVASAAERQQLEELASRRQQLETRIEELPTTADGYADRTKTKLARLEALEKKVAQQAVLVQSLQAQLVALQKLFADTASSKKPKVRETFRKESEAIKMMMIGLQSELEELRHALADARNSVGVGGADEVAERNVKEQFTSALQDEHKALQELGARLSGEEAQRFRALAALYDRTDKIQGVLNAFDEKLDAGVESKLTSIRAALAEEKEHVSRYGVEAADYKTRTDSVAGGITYNGFQDVAQRFYEIVVRADVGIIDVAWALKDAKSKEVSRLVRQRRMDLKVLDSEFKEVLREE
jgi:archaellum component FlaC